MHDRQQPFNQYEQGPDFDRARSQIATPFQYFDIALDVAASNRIFNVSGNFLYIDSSSTGIATLELNNQYNDASAPFQIQAGFGIEALFKQVKISWSAQVGKRLRLLYSTGDRVVPTNSTAINGVVNTVDGGLTRTLADKAIMGLASTGPVAAQYALTQLWNPVASTKNLYLESATISTAVAQLVEFGTYNVAYPTLKSEIQNKYCGHAAGVGEVRATNNVALLASVFGPIFSLSAGQPVIFNFKEPVVIPPGWGFIVTANTLNTNLYSSFEWYEDI